MPIICYYFLNQRRYFAIIIPKEMLSILILIFPFLSDTRRILVILRLAYSIFIILNINNFLKILTCKFYQSIKLKSMPLRGKVMFIIYISKNNRISVSQILKLKSEDFLFIRNYTKIQKVVSGFKTEILYIIHISQEGKIPGNGRTFIPINLYSTFSSPNIHRYFIKESLWEDQFFFHCRILEYMKILFQ